MTITREQLLIFRIVDGEAAPHEWREFESSADLDIALWRQLAQAQRDHHALSYAFDAAGAVADFVALPSRAERAPEFKLNRLGAWTGWAVAALVAIVASVQFAAINRSSSTTPNHTQQAGLSVLSAAEAFQTYLDKGRDSGEVVGEIPDRVLVESQPALSGNGVEVIYIRQVLERAIVPDLYQFTGQDEAGRPTLVRYKPPVRNSM